MSTGSPPLPPGFRFHPTDEELILHYLYKRASSTPFPLAIIAEVDIYKFNPWDLPAKAMFGEREWYFFSPRDRKYPNGVRPNRSAASGYWKATGSDKPITSKSNENIGVKKALVFYQGKPTKGLKTNWIMHEYRLAAALNYRPLRHKEGSMRLDDWVLCRIYQKTSHQSLMDREQEDSGGEEAGLQNSENINKTHKSFPLSEFLIEEADLSLLSKLLDTPLPPAIPGKSDPAPFYNSNSNQSNSQGKKTECSVFTADGGMKRQRMVENHSSDEPGGHISPHTKLNTSNIYAQFSNQFDISQPFFNQQLLLNSHLGMH